MPGSFPFGSIFSALGNLVSGHSGSSNSGSSNEANNRESPGARSSGDTTNLASIDERHEGGAQSQQGQQLGQNQQGARQEHQGQPDLDLDLD